LAGALGAGRDRRRRRGRPRLGAAVSDLLARLPLLDIAINERLSFRRRLLPSPFSPGSAWRRGGGSPPAGGSRLLGAAVVATLGALLVWLRRRCSPPACRLRLSPKQSWWLLSAAGLAAIVGVASAWAPALGLLLAALAVQRLGEMGDFYPTLPTEYSRRGSRPIDAIPPGNTPFRSSASLARLPRT